MNIAGYPGDELCGQALPCPVHAALTPEHEPPSAREGAAPVCVECGWAGRHAPDCSYSNGPFEPAAPHPVAEPPAAEVVPRPELCAGCSAETPEQDDACTSKACCCDQQSIYDAGHASAQVELAALRQRVRVLERGRGLMSKALRSRERERANLLAPGPGRDAVEAAAQEVATWPAWKRGHSTADQAALATLRKLASVFINTADSTRGLAPPEYIAARDALRAALRTL